MLEFCQGCRGCGGSYSPSRERETLQQNIILHVIKRICQELRRKFPRRRTGTRRSMDSGGFHQSSRDRRAFAVQHVKFWRRADQFRGVRRSDEEKSRTTFTALRARASLDVSSPPFLENLRQKCLEALCLVGPVDDYAVQQLKDFVRKKLMKMTRRSCRIVDSPCVLTTQEHGWSANMERIMESPMGRRDNSMTSNMVSKKTTEVNPTHSIKTELRKRSWQRI